ncbi:MAG: hypothetical protein IPL50_19305 [Chitinophagaceae bacterium]|nr:hypothetical protein [Chitinophagaceae bacterium]
MIIPIGLAAADAGNIPAFKATNATAAPINATITVTSIAGTRGYTNVIHHQVNPAGQVNPIANQVLVPWCIHSSGQLTTTVPGTVFSWSNDNTSIGLAATGQGNIPSFIAQNPTGVPQVATITVSLLMVPRWYTGNSKLQLYPGSANICCTCRCNFYQC